VFFWAVVSDEINRVIEFFPTLWQAERMLAKVLWDEPGPAGAPTRREDRVQDGDGELAAALPQAFGLRHGQARAAPEAGGRKRTRRFSSCLNSGA